MAASANRPVGGYNNGYNRPQTGPLLPSKGYVPGAGYVKEKTREDMAQVTGVDSLHISQAARTASAQPSLGFVAPQNAMDFSVDSGYNTVQLSGRESEQELAFINFLTRKQGKEPVIPKELRTLDTQIVQILGGAGMQTLRPHMIHEQPRRKELRGFLFNLKNPGKLLSLLKQRHMSPGLVAVRENGVMKKKRLEGTGYEILAALNPPLTALQLEQFLQDYVQSIPQTRISTWMDTMNMQDFESETERILKLYRKPMNQVEGRQHELRLLLQKDPENQEARQELRTLIPQVRAEVQEYIGVYGDLKMAPPPDYARDNLKKLTREKLVEPIFVDLVKRLLYGETELNQHMVFVASKLCDSQGVDLYIADPSTAQRYIAADLTTSAKGYYDKLAIHEGYEKEGNAYKYTNFGKFTKIARDERFVDEFSIDPFSMVPSAEGEAEPFNFDPKHIKKEVLYLDTTLWMPLLEYVVEGVQRGTYEDEKEHLNIRSLEQVYEQVRLSGVQRPWKKYTTLKAYLAALLKHPEEFAPPRQS